MALCSQYDMAEVTPERCQERHCSFHQGLLGRLLWGRQLLRCEDTETAPGEAHVVCILQATCVSHFGHASSSPRQAFRKLQAQLTPDCHSIRDPGRSHPTF